MKEISNSHKNIFNKPDSVLYFNIKGFGESKYFYTSLMQVYTDIDADMGYKILQEMIEKGIEPDLPVYTSLINSYRHCRKL